MKLKSKLSKSSLLYNFILTIGIVIGVGVFFKNQVIISASHGNPVYVISAWVIGGLISVASAFAFADIVHKLKNNNNNLSEFMKMSFGEKAGNFAKKSYAFVYYPIYSFVISIFSTSYLLDIFGAKDNMALLFGLSILFALLIIVVVTTSEKIATALQVSTTLIKIIPFVIMIVIVVIGIFVSSDSSFFHTQGNHVIANGHKVHGYDSSAAKQTLGMDGASIIFWLVPATKFTFDGFLSVTANRKNTTPKTLKTAMTLGMIFILIIYLFAAIATLMSGEYRVPEAIVSSLGGDVYNLTTSYNVLFIFIKVVIILSGFGALNGFTIVWKQSVVQLVEDEGIKSNGNVIMKYMLIGLGLSVLPWVILSLALWNQHIGYAIIDRISDIVLLFAFSVNAIMLGKFIIMYFKKKLKLKKLTLFFMLFAMTGIAIVTGYKIVDDLIIEMIKHGNESLFGTIPRFAYIGLFLGVAALVAVVPLFMQRILVVTKYKESQ